MAETELEKLSVDFDINCRNLKWTRLPATQLRDQPELLSDWNRLNDLRGGLPFLTGGALISALEGLGGGKEVLFVGKTDNVSIAMFVMVPDTLFRWRTFQPSQLPLGAWVADRIVRLPALINSLITSIPGFWLTVSITQIDPLLGELPLDSNKFSSRDYIETAWVDIEDNFEEYWSQRGKNLRQNMRKQRNKLAADGIDARMRVITDRADIGAAVQRYGVIESSGWKAEQGTSINPDNAQGRFYLSLLEDAADHHEAIIYEYLFDDRTVAMSLCLRRRETLVMLKTTYDESVKTLSPAFLLNQDLLRHLFNEGIAKRLEYFGRVMEWHTRWTSNRRALFHLTFYRWPFIKFIADKRRRRESFGTLAASASS